MIKNKRAQVNEVFTYIMAIIIIGMILLFGVKYIIKLQHNIQSIDLVQFKSQVESTAQKYAYQYGSWTKKDFSVPREIEFVCFFDLSKHTAAATSNICTGTAPASDPNKDVGKQPLLCDGWQQGKEGTQNIMTVPFTTENPIHIGRLEVDNTQGYKCFKVTAGKFTATITGLGDGVKIS